VTERRSRDAIRGHVDSLNRALNCLTDERLITSQAPSDGKHAGVYSITTRGRDASAEGSELGRAGTVLIWLSAAQRVLVQVSSSRRDPFIEVLTYSYRLGTEVDSWPREIVAFQWTPDEEPPQRPYSHLHVGSLVTGGSRFRPDDFNKLHIPTGFLTLEAVMLFAIEELGVEPAQGRERETVLTQLREGDRAARQARTPGEDR